MKPADDDAPLMIKTKKKQLEKRLGNKQRRKSTTRPQNRKRSKLISLIKERKRKAQAEMQPQKKGACFDNDEVG